VKDHAQALDLPARSGEIGWPHLDPALLDQCNRPSAVLNTKTHAGTLGVRAVVSPSRLTTATKGWASPTDRPSLLFEWLLATPPAKLVWQTPGRLVATHGVTDASYMLTIVDRGADVLAGTGRIGGDLAAALKSEARRRVETGTFFGDLAYASVIAVR